MTDDQQRLAAISKLYLALRADTTEGQLLAMLTTLREVPTWWLRWACYDIATGWKEMGYPKPAHIIEAAKMRARRHAADQKEFDELPLGKVQWPIGEGDAPRLDAGDPTTGEVVYE